jgi:hypothetical protein
MSEIFTYSKLGLNLFLLLDLIAKPLGARYWIISLEKRE